MFRIVTLLFFTISATICMAQDTLLLLNGKTLNVNITDDSGANIFFEAKKKNGKLKNYELHKTEVFSVTKEGKQESVLYVQDPDFGYELSVEDMRFYMAGQNDARQGYNTWPSAAGGFAFGAASVFYFEGGYAPFLSPFIYSPLMQIPFIKIKESSISDKRYTVSDYYVEGYNKTARSKKLVKNFAGTMAGVILGSIIFETTQ